MFENKPSEKPGARQNGRKDRFPPLMQLGGLPEAVSSPWIEFGMLVLAGLGSELLPEDLQEIDTATL